MDQQGGGVNGIEAPSLMAVSAFRDPAEYYMEDKFYFGYCGPCRLALPPPQTLVLMFTFPVLGQRQKACNPETLGNPRQNMSNLNAPRVKEQFGHGHGNVLTKAVESCDQA
jgi:hypothetical protein